MWPERVHRARRDEAARGAARRATASVARRACARRSPRTSASRPSARTCGGWTRGPTRRVTTLPFVFESELGLDHYSASPASSLDVMDEPARRLCPARPLGVDAAGCRALGLVTVAADPGGSSSTSCCSGAVARARCSGCCLSLSVVPGCAGGAGAGTSRDEGIDIRHGTLPIGARSSRGSASSTWRRARGLTEQALRARHGRRPHGGGLAHDPDAGRSPTRRRCASASPRWRRPTIDA